MFGRDTAPTSLRGNNDDKACFIEQTKLAREERARKVLCESSAIKIQSLVRGFMARRNFVNTVRNNLDDAISFVNSVDYIPKLKPALEVFRHANRYVVVLCKDCAYTKRVEALYKYILHSLTADSVKMSYLSLLLNKETSTKWMDHIKKLLVLGLNNLSVLKPENIGDMKGINTILTMIVSFTSTVSWKILTGKGGDVLRPAMNQLCINIINHLTSKSFYHHMETLLFNGIVRSKPVFKAATFTATCTLLLRFMSVSGNAENSIREFLLHIMSIPALFYHMEIISHDMYIKFNSNRVFTSCLSYLSNDDQLQALAVTLESNRTVCLIGNLIQLGLSEMEGIVSHPGLFSSVLSKLIEVCGEFMAGKKANRSHWHPILGWSSRPYKYNDAVPYLTNQLHLLWEARTVRLLCNDLYDFCESKEAYSSSVDDKKSGNNMLKKKSEKKSASSKIISAAAFSTCVTCHMYQNCIAVFAQMKPEILTGLAFNADFLRNIWFLIKNLGGSNCGLKQFLEALSSAEAARVSGPPLTSMLALFCESAIMLFMILDDVEMYEKQKPFTLEDLVSMSDMLNQLVFKSVWQDILDWRHADDNALFGASHSLLLILHERDSRRTFTPANHWLIKEIRPSQFISSIDKGNKTAQFLLQKMPHIVPHKDRVVLFRKFVINEKESLGITESSHTTPNITFITVSRQRILEDGYRQLASLPVIALKGIVRVKFVNEQGLDEAGIDQDGVFKEFLEETIKRVFNPGLNLFQVTADQKLYPSPTSYLQENHLALYEFVGRMLGKAVYEGLVVDVPFAPFFLTQVLDNTKNSMYSYFDELPSLDAELYKNLTYVKHYEGDVRDLELNFSYDEDVLGRIQNYELKPGGRAISVSNENKISYVHYMARYKMHTRIKEQTMAFIRGFKSIVNYDWLRMFSTPEVQKLISGDTVDIDLADLRKHTQYYGGFHNSHRVINWLWDILQKDFNEDERKQFLKFVTSCSKPPLLGFSQLDPPFSIRCVEVSDDQDTGDTIGSVLKGFFSIRRREPVGRLPTSSTCFNLLKLPNYSKKSILRDKLRYSITSNTGFELS